MAPGDDGANVTIPAIFIEDATGTVLTAEMANGRWAMIGFVAAIGAYVTTGQIIPGIF